MVAVVGDVGQGEADDPGEWLGVEQDGQRDHSVDRCDGVVGVDASDEVCALAVADRWGVAGDGDGGGQREAWDVVVVDGPAQKGPGALSGAARRGGEPAI
ncbi:hypothetical protein [Kribbella sp. CA-294648]|uniref:hypothetical protein n=1 Tax=Kribbella sp. CA-294648 TaxID=3239948 RepID=UPI003D90678D